MPSPLWSDWQPLPGLPAFAPAVLAETLDGGQSFRWQQAGDGTWQGVWADCIARLRLAGTPHTGPLEWSAPAAMQARVAKALPVYLTGSSDFSALADTLPWRSDSHLARCLAAFPGLALPRQPFGETLLCFLCSATKQIVQIKQMVALLAARHGTPLLPTSGSMLHASVNRLPTWPALAAIPEAGLRACLLGFRARYIKATALYLAARPGWLAETEQLPYTAAKRRLLELPGVGEKIADCVLLFGAGRLEAFPVDTWILKALTRHYGLSGWSPAQVAHFGRSHFGPLAGLAQQYLFAWERAQARTAK
jgi:N-glycosylase/DNA lyase